MNLKIKFELEETKLKGEIENLIPSSSGGSLPSGGTTGQVLTKNSNADGDAGWSTPEPFVINSGEHYNQLFVNKSYAEIKEAYEFGKNVVIIWNNKQYPLSSISDEKVEFIVEESITNSDDYTMYNIHTRTLAIYSESGKRATKDYTNLNVYSIKGSDESFAPKASAVLTTEQTLTTDQQSQALENIGGLSKNQGIANSGKFLGIGADGIVVPTDVGGGSSEWTELYQGTIEVPEPVSSLTVDLIRSCEGMTEAVMSFASTKGEGELTGNTSMHCKFGLFGVTYGRLGNYSSAQEDKYYFIAPNKNQSMFYKNSPHQVNLNYNTSPCITGWVEPSVISNPNYNQMVIEFWGSPGYQGTITLRIVGR